MKNAAVAVADEWEISDARRNAALPSRPVLNRYQVKFESARPTGRISYGPKRKTGLRGMGGLILPWPLHT